MNVCWGTRKQKEKKRNAHLYDESVKAIASAVSSVLQRANIDTSTDKITNSNARGTSDSHPLRR